MVLPFASRHVDNTEYAKENILRRMSGNIRLAETVVKGMRPVLGRKGDLLLPTRSLQVDFDKILNLLEMIIRGLNFFHFGRIIPSNHFLKVSMFARDKEDLIVEGTLRAIGPHPRTVRGDLGRGTFVYEALCSTIDPDTSMWHFQLFGRVVFAGDPNAPNVGYSDFLGITMKPAKGPLLSGLSVDDAIRSMLLS